MTHNNVADIIRAFRAKHRLAAKYVAEKMGISSAYLSMIEQGKKGVSRDRLDPLIELFKEYNEPTEELMLAYYAEAKLYRAATLPVVLRRVIFRLVESNLTDDQLRDLERQIIEATDGK
jgi:DNA-binding helix-turn-helix protein